jgi:hypothetical protein
VFVGVRGTIPDNDRSAQIQNTDTSTGTGQLEEERGGETEPLLPAAEPLNQGKNKIRSISQWILIDHSRLFFSILRGE